MLIPRIRQNSCRTSCWSEEFFLSLPHLHPFLLSPFPISSFDQSLFLVFLLPFPPSSPRAVASHPPLPPIVPPSSLLSVIPSFISSSCSFSSSSSSYRPSKISCFCHPFLHLLLLALILNLFLISPLLHLFLLSPVLNFFLLSPPSSLPAFAPP